MNWFSPVCTVLVSLAGYALLCWEAGRPQPAPSREIVISIPGMKEFGEACADAIVKIIIEEVACRDQALQWSPVFSVLLGGMTSPDFWLGICTSGGNENHEPL